MGKTTDKITKTTKKRVKMSTKAQKHREELFDNADRFIAMANELAGKNSSGIVGAALRYAAARYSAFEASTAHTDMERDKEEIKKELFNDYALMLEENLQVYINHQKSQQPNS